jgi:hypothetical protein
MYKVLIASSNAEVLEHINAINKENGKIVFATNDRYSMYFIYEVTEHRSEI